MSRRWLFAAVFALAALPACAQDAAPLLLPASETVAAPSVEAKPSSNKVAEVSPFSLKDRDGLTLAPRSFDETPLELRLRLRFEAGSSSFWPTQERYTDQTGRTRPIEQRSVFEVERLRVVLDGKALHPSLKYLFQFAGDSDTGGVELLDGYLTWAPSKPFAVNLGKLRVPGSREWSLPVWTGARFSDRSMANGYFRPDRTFGVSASGELPELAGLRYVLLVGNSAHARTAATSLLDRQFVYSANATIEPHGSFGEMVSDFAMSPEARTRFGGSATFAAAGGGVDGTVPDELTRYRLSDGTRLTDSGALGPAATVVSANAALYTLDWAFKRNGFSTTHEVYFRTLDRLRGNAPLRRDRLFDWGFASEAGWFVAPQALELLARWSQLDGDFGGASEGAFGAAWYPTKQPGLRWVFEIRHLDGNPAEVPRGNLIPGQTGWGFLTRLIAFF